ncbi:hypothetical protein CEXT_656151 [Caerostris extrusa]|uniref:Uncharacterized protein n=1 Tax=Caerostris extrusa TaxID=172846 RepID=A0AAV4MYY4_CAEEX|nr:hypothetical protein CEXT_656151 [Caerostris extrusa]
MRMAALTTVEDEVGLCAGPDHSLAHLRQTAVVLENPKADSVGLNSRRGLNRCNSRPGHLHQSGFKIAGCLV